MRSAHAFPFPHRFTRREYHRIAEMQLFLDERVELLDGVIVSMSAQRSAHASTVQRLVRLLLRMVGPEASVRAQAPIILDDWSEPEPDVAVCNLDPDDYAREHPRANQVQLVIEVADTSLAYDRTQKAAAYAASRITAYWIVNLVDRRVEVLADPDPVASRYRSEVVAAEGDTVVLPNGKALAVADILPPG